MEENDPFVERTYRLKGTELKCRFYRPIFDGQDYSCRCEILWPHGARSRNVWGVDGVQALLLAMQSVHGDLLLYRERDGLDVRWFESKELGLPTVGENTAPGRD